MSQYSVQKCICHNKSFEEVKNYADKNGIKTVEKLQEHHYCSCGCQRCISYIELVLETGQTSFKPGVVYRS